MMGELNPHENPTHMMQIPKHNNVHDNKFESASITDKKLTVLGEMDENRSRMMFRGKQNRW